MALSKMRVTVGASTTLTSRANSEEGKKGGINEYLVLAGIISALVAVLFLVFLVCLQRLREKRLLKLAEIEHRKRETVKISTGTEEKKDGQKLSAEALQSETPDVTPAKAAASPSTATSGDYANAADLILDILTASTQAEEVDIQSS